MQEEISRLKFIELRDIWPNEAADFTPWLAEEENLYPSRRDARHGT